MVLVLLLRLQFYVVVAFFVFQLVNSDSGPGFDLAQALWHSGDTTNKVNDSFISQENKITNTYLPAVL